MVKCKETKFTDYLKTEIADCSETTQMDQEG